MTEKKFLNLVLLEGIILSILGIIMLIIPKITTLSLGITLSLALIIYGFYKAINAFISRNYVKHYLLDIFIGILVSAIGLVLFFSPMFNLILLTSLIGICFLLESISTGAFAIQNKKTLYYWWANIPVAILQFILGLIIILGLPTTAIWIIGVLIGINFLITGMVMISASIATKYDKF